MSAVTSWGGVGTHPEGFPDPVTVMPGSDGADLLATPSERLFVVHECGPATEMELHQALGQGAGRCDLGLLTGPSKP